MLKERREMPSPPGPLSLPAGEGEPSGLDILTSWFGIGTDDASCSPSPAGRERGPGGEGISRRSFSMPRYGRLTKMSYVPSSDLTGLFGLTFECAREKASPSRHASNDGLSCHFVTTRYSPPASLRIRSNEMNPATSFIPPAFFPNACSR